MYMLTRFIIYGFAGWGMEIIWTGLESFFKGDVSLAGGTYLWMFPIYGLAVFLESIHDKIRSKSWLVRGLVWLSIIWIIEYTTGWIIKSITGLCPWDYSRSSPYSVNGFIRLDMAPAWFAAGFIFEKLHDLLDRRVEIRSSPD